MSGNTSGTPEASGGELPTKSTTDGSPNVRKVVVNRVSEAEAQAALNTARNAVFEIMAAVREEKRKAEAEIDARYHADLKAAQQVVAAAALDLQAAQDRCQDHPWAGKRVFKMVAQGRVWDREPPKRVEGVVETRRSNTDFPGNVGDYSLPQIGDGFVRLLKKDGTPGAKFERMYPNDAWKLVEDEPATAS